MEETQNRSEWMFQSSRTLRILVYLVNTTNGIYKYFKVINTTASVAGRGLVKIKDNADTKVEECKMLSNKCNLE